MDFDLTDINKYATGIGFQDSIIWDYDTKQPTGVHNQTKALGMIVHVWTFKDDVLIFDSKNNMEMYHKGQNLLKLDGVITEFADIYAPVAQLIKNQSGCTISQSIEN